MSTRAPRRPKTRERILVAARDVFLEEGYSGFTMSEVERRVGLAVGTGSIYRHFASREALLQAVLEEEIRVNRSSTEQTRSELEHVSDPIELRQKVYKQKLDDLRRFNRFFALMLDQGERVPELREAIRIAVQPPQDGASARGQIEPFAMAALGGYHLFSIMQGGPFNGLDEDEFLRVLAEFIEQRANSSSTARKDGRRRISR
jgi:AcrR family transcriptional regulator